MLNMFGQTFQIEDEDETREMDSSDYGSSDESEYGDASSDEWEETDIRSSQRFDPAATVSKAVVRLASQPSQTFPCKTKPRQPTYILKPVPPYRIQIDGPTEPDEQRVCSRKSSYLTQ